MTEKRLPLEHFTVLDLTQARSGPTAARMLADWGANVISIEPPPTAGLEQPGLSGDPDSFDYQNLHRNKRSLTINLKHDEGYALFMRLAAQADVIVENFRPDVKHRLKIDYETVAKTNPRIVYGSISGFGQEGPYARRPGLDQVAQGIGGLMSITGQPGRGPVRVGIPITDLCAGMFLAQGIVLALLDRERTGKGQWVHTSLLEAMIFMLDFQAARWLQKGEVAGQAGNDHPTGMPQSCFETADQPINVAAAGSLFPRLCKAIGAEELIDRPEYQGHQNRSDNREQLKAEISAVLRQKPAAHWIEVLNAAGVPCGPVNTIDQVFADPQVGELDMVHHVDHHRLGELAVVGQPVHLSDAPQPERFRYPAPDTGEHTDEILGELGLDRDEIERLHCAGAV